MKIHILTMEEPLYTLHFIEEIIDARHGDITGITIAKGGRLKIGKKRSKTSYITSLLLIMGPLFFTRNVLKTLSFKAQKKIPFLKETGLRAIAEKYNIPVDYTGNPDSKEYLDKLKEVDPDVLINQSQFIIKKELLDIPKMGVLNRHNALLPKNRGRLTPFWVLYKKENETGVSIHLVDEGIDSGPIVVQKKFTISEKDTFKTVVEKNYELASGAILEALDLLENGYADFIENKDEEATYNPVPTLKQAFEFRKRRMWRGFWVYEFRG